jgi:hypothetical protein
MRTSSRLMLFAALTAVGGILTASAATAAPSGGATAPSGRAAAARTYTLKIRGLDRAGKRVPIEPSVFGAANGVDYLTYLQSVTVPAGRYVVAAAVPEPGQNSATLVAKTLTVRSNSTVVLSAVRAVPILASLTGLPSPNVMQANQQAMLCVRHGRAFVPVTGLLIVPTLVKGNAAPGQMYVKPMTGSGLRFVYQTYWEGLGPLYEEASAFNGGIPSRTDYRQSAGGMATLQVQLRAHENLTPLRNVVESYGNCGSLTVPEETLPVTYTDYRTPGRWLTQLNFGSSKIVLSRVLTQAGTYRGGRTYALVLGSAVEEPKAGFPVIAGAAIRFVPRGLFADPLAADTDCEGHGRVTLTPSGGSSAMKLCGKYASFTGHPRRPGWYTLTADFTRTPSRGILLSNAVTLSWRFRYAPLAGSRAEAAPVTVTEFRPEGLGLSNDAAGGTATTLKVSLLRGGGQPVPTPRYRLTRVQVQVSFTNGRSWHALALQARSGSWFATIENPPAGGYVSLRSVVTDARGDKTVETVTRAYLVDAA